MLQDKVNTKIVFGDNVDVITIDIETVSGRVIEKTDSGICIKIKNVTKPSLSKYVGEVCFIPNTQITIIIKD